LCGTRILLEDPDSDGVIVLSLHYLPTLQEDFIDRAAEMTINCIKPVVTCDVSETEWFFTSAQDLRN
jgi:hypothetical protein